MKNTLALVLALAVVSSPAYASRARLEALGEGKNGSYYVNDSRNMFLNPASIVKHKKKLLLELGNDEPTAATGGAFVDLPVTTLSRAQGGFINTFGDFTYAVYLNNISDTSMALFAGQRPTNAFEVSFAGEGTIGWGLSVVHGYGPTGANTVNTWGARFGAKKDDLAVFGTVGLFGKSVTAGVETKSKLNLDLGATYQLGDFTAFGNFVAGSLENDVAKTSAYALGIGHKKEMTKSTTMFTRVEARKRKVENSAANFDGWNLPVVMGAEAQALSWLTLRGSITHSLFGQTDVASTSVAAGVGMTFGDVSIDGLVATNNTTPQLAGNLGTNGIASNNTFGFGDGMISRIAMTYNF